ncbi:restriction endonuclease subunit S [Limnohabitans sp.]|uniref:restriction endonuclease subunit S n=1 Tax=Limnohabitans sp. TaxID=1907725 RepID=UPI0035B3A618
MKSGWEIKPLGELCEFQRGLTYAKSDEVAESNVVVLRANNVDLETNTLDFTDLRYIANTIDVPNEKRIKKGSLLICTASGSKSHLGKVAFIDNEYDYAFGGFMGQITPKPEMEGRYLLHVMTSPAYKDFIAALSDGANINNLKFNDLRNFQVAVPSIAEQRRIVTLLDEAFADIATAKVNAEKNLQNARELASELSSQILSAPSANCTTQSLEDIVEADCSLSYGIVQPGDEFESGLPIVRPVDLDRPLIELDGLKRIDPTLAKGYERTKLKGGEVLLCVRGTTGTLSCASSALAGANVTRGIVPIRFNPNCVSQELGYFLMRSAPVQAQIRAKTYGTALMQINIRDLRQIQIPVPHPSQQAAIAKALQDAEEQTNRLTEIQAQKLTALDDLKKSLLHQAFSGQL